MEKVTKYQDVLANRKHLIVLFNLFNHYLNE